MSEAMHLKTESSPLGCTAKTREVSARNSIYRQNILDAPYEICVERARYYTESYKSTEGQDPHIRAAKALAHTIDNMSLYILPEEAIVGNRSSKLVATVIPVERGEINLVLELELDRLQKRPDRPFHISPSEKRELREAILPYWNGKTVRDHKRRLWQKNGLWFPLNTGPAALLQRIRTFGLGAIANQVKQAGGNPKLMARAGREIPLNNPGLVMNVFDTQGHLVIGHVNMIKEGFKGTHARAKAGLEHAGDDASARAFLEAVMICSDAARRYAERMAELADREAAACSDPGRAEELHAIAERCRRVPWETPRDFREAVQFVWFTQVMALISYGIVGVFALGRVDQYLWPFLEADLASGVIDEEGALALIEELIIKLSYNLLVLPPYGKDTGSELGADNMAVTIGGVGRDGEDATNQLSWMFLRATESMKSMSNSISFRISEKSSDDWVEAVVGAHRSSNGPSIFNDDAIVLALADTGYTIEDARDYAIIGCVEPTSDGNTYGCTSGNDISLVGALEMTLNNGKLLMLGRKVGPATGDPRSFNTFDEFLGAFKKQISASVDLIAEGTKLKDQVYAEHYPCPFISTTLLGCVDNARDATRGGAKYNFDSISARGLATAVDSLAAIRQAVFEEKTLTMDELVGATLNDFKNRKALRQRLKTRAPKFGVDDDRADGLAREIAEHFCREVMKHKTDRGGIFRPSFFSYGMHVFEGSMLAATPDGRQAGEAISNSLSPTNQADGKGPVAALRSVSKIDHRLIPNGSSTNIKLMPTLLEKETGLKKVAAMLRAYFKQGGQQVQFNVISNELLKKAQQNPEQYKDLVVRVSGYSAYFVDLGKPVQDDIIARSSFDNT